MLPPCHPLLAVTPCPRPQPATLVCASALELPVPKLSARPRGRTAFRPFSSSPARCVQAVWRGHLVRRWFRSSLVAEWMEEFGSAAANTSKQLPREEIQSTPFSPVPSSPSYLSPPVHRSGGFPLPHIARGLCPFTTYRSRPSLHADLFLLAAFALDRPCPPAAPGRLHAAAFLPSALCHVLWRTSPTLPCLHGCGQSWNNSTPRWAGSHPAKRCRFGPRSKLHLPGG